MAEKSFGVKDLNIVGASGDPTIESNGDLNLKGWSSCNPDQHHSHRSSYRIWICG